jgi:amylosucrase
MNIQDNSYMDKIKKKYMMLYPESRSALDTLLKTLETFRNNRPRDLKQRDLERCHWIHAAETIGMMLYVDLFSDDLKGLISKSDYFESLGITLIHLMPVLKRRHGENDGGYAVSDYHAIDPKIGDLKDLIDVIAHYHVKGIRVCIDYVINHTSDDHEWALRAKAGDKIYQGYYFMFDDKIIPNQYERTLPEVFPVVSPGNFTYNKLIDKWIMTTFYPFQWDLNYRNPLVFAEMVSNLLFFANIGVDLIRLDAIPYVWKTIGTDCRNQPEAHLILSLFRDIIEWCAPSTGLLGEAIISPEIIVKYFGTDKDPECHILYNASYMVEIWNSLATRDTRHISLMPDYNIENNGEWINYARCHDDIGWGLDIEKTWSLGFNPHDHKQFLIDFYLGIFEGSFSSGELYEFNPKTKDARISGTLASLAGLEKAILNSDQYQLELSIKRISLINALFILKKGIPMIYSGDETGQMNDYTYHEVYEKKHDSRWLHRSKMRWEVIKNPENICDVHTQIFHNTKKMIKIRKELYGITGISKEQILHQRNNHIMVLQQHICKDDSNIILFFNTSEDRQWIDTSDLKRYGLSGILREYIQGKLISLENEKILMGPYEFFVTIKENKKKT